MKPPTIPPVPAGFADLLERPIVASFCTVMPDGSPQMSVLWRLWQPPYVLVCTPPYTLKGRNITLEKRVALLMIDPDNPKRYLAVYGKVVAVDQDVEGKLMDRLYQHYEGRARYNGVVPVADQERLYNYRILPTRFAGVLYE